MAWPSRPTASRTRPLGRVPAATRVLTAAGQAVDSDRVVELVADAVRREWNARASWGKRSRAVLVTVAADVGDGRRLGENETENAAKIAAVTSPRALAASGGICGPVDVDYTVNVIATNAGRSSSRWRPSRPPAAGSATPCR
jgi:hypothetical protein